MRAQAAAHGVDPARLVFVDDAADARLADYTQLTDVALRRVREPAEGMFIAESEKIIRRALAAGIAPRSFLMTPRWFAGIADVLGGSSAAAGEGQAGALGEEAPIFIGSAEVLESLTGFHLHRGALAAMARPVLPTVEAVVAGARRVVIVEDVVDHTNLGAIFRSAAGLGVDAVLITPRSADPLYRRSIRVSMGTVFQVPWTRIDPWPGGLAALRAAGFHTAALALDERAVSLREFARSAPERVALIMGTEGDGLRRSTLEAADSTVLIPMAGGVDSLNVAAATAVACYALQQD
ncbi:TrmH family RNA methyltransferase [Brevibacterium sp. BRM-1]|uniref:TrmH family RNA methyltransferase n=1 Tax=Brevibacterium sp. BRM-1 TaxID=2999062 RepID=UPI003FA45B16